MVMNVKRSALLIVLLSMFLLMPHASYAENIAVDLIWKFPEPGWLEVEILQGRYQVTYDEDKKNIQRGDTLKIGRSLTNSFIYQGSELSVLVKPMIRFTTEPGGILRVREPEKDWVSYRGELEITANKTSWKLTNTLDREDYLKGVVPIEMSNAWATKGFEALKAQAVAARTYLLKNIDAGGRITDSPDIHQAYWGRTVEGQASQAVEATKGEVLVDAQTGEPISIFYSAHNGGYSEETQNVWQSHDPHYTALPDPFSQGVGGIVSRWSFLIAADVLGKHFDLAPIREVQLKKYSSGRVYEVNLIDWLGNQKTVSGGAFVQKFYPYGRNITKESFLGRLFEADYIFPAAPDQKKTQLEFGMLSGEITADRPSGPLLTLVKSSNEGISDEPGKFGLFIFNGRGWGHGVGMSQWGAYNMAMQGYSYDSILSYYYQNSVLANKS